MHKLRENAEKELKAIEEKGLTSSNLDNAFKLVEIMKGVDKIEMMESGEYSNDGYSRDREDYSNRGRGGYSRDGGYSNDYDNDNSYRRGRNQRTGEYMHRPNYSRLSGDDEDMERYRERKKEYSNSRDEGSKGRMLDALEDFMCGVSAMVKQICRDADCREEREKLQRCKEKGGRVILPPFSSLLFILALVCAMWYAIHIRKERIKWHIQKHRKGRVGNIMRITTSV